jgi:hypothetical protein
VVEVSDEKMDSETFDYEDRGGYSGADIEAEMARRGFEGVGLRVARALFRFANRDDLRFCQRGMETSVAGKRLSEHPLDDIDVPSGGRWEGVHLDIFLPESVRVFGEEFGFDPESMVLMREGARRRREGGLLLDREVVSRGVESLV